MARLAIDKDFLDDYSKLPKPVQNSVKTAIDKFAEHVHAGLHLEKINRCKDDRIRTIRIDINPGAAWFSPPRPGAPTASSRSSRMTRRSPTQAATGSRERGARRRRSP